MSSKLTNAQIQEFAEHIIYLTGDTQPEWIDLFEMAEDFLSEELTEADAHRVETCLNNAVTIIPDNWYE